MSDLTKDQDKFWKYLKGERPGLIGQRTANLGKLMKHFAKDGINRTRLWNEITVVSMKKN